METVLKAYNYAVLVHMRMGGHSEDVLIVSGLQGAITQLIFMVVCVCSGTLCLMLMLQQPFYSLHAVFKDVQ